MTTEPDSVTHSLMELVMNGTERERIEAEGALRRRETAAVREIRAYLESNTGRVVRGRPDYPALCKLAEHLASYGAPEATTTLVAFALEAQIPGDVMPGSRALRPHLELLHSRTDPAAVRARIGALEGLLGKSGYTGDVIELAEDLTLLAERQPMPVLFAALKVIKPGWRKPKAFQALYPRLRAALGAGDLPLVAHGVRAERDLPVPGNETKNT